MVVPNVVGMNLNEVKKILKGFKIEYSGSGEEIVYQTPAAGMYQKDGGTIVVMLN